MNFLCMIIIAPFTVMSVLGLMEDKYVYLDHAKEIEFMTGLNAIAQKEPTKTMNLNYVLSVKYLKKSIYYVNF